MIITRLGEKGDIEGILALQALNLFSNLNEKEREQGFVTTPFTGEQIEEIISQKGVFISENEHKVVIAYAFSGSWAYFAQWEIFKFMTARFSKLSFHGHRITTINSFQYGPVCIARDYRGNGLLNVIFEEMRKEFCQKYPISVTFINKINVISTKAHTQKLGWEIIDEFEFNNNTYIKLAVDMKKSVIY